MILQFLEDFYLRGGQIKQDNSRKIFAEKYNTANLKKFWEGLKNETQHERGNRLELPSDVT